VVPKLSTVKLKEFSGGKPGIPRKLQSSQMLTTLIGNSSVALYDNPQENKFIYLLFIVVCKPGLIN
jgi:hypothetical protein